MSKHPDKIKKIVFQYPTTEREKLLKFNISQLLIFKKQYLNQYLKEKTTPISKAYAVKSDDSKEQPDPNPTEYQKPISAYADNNSEDGKPNRIRSLEKPKKTNYPKAYAPNQGDDGEKPMTLKPG